MKIENESPQRLFKLIRMCHPNEKGEKYFRGDVIEEIRKRHIEIFKALGWNISPKYIYKNRFTATEEELKDVIDNGCQGQTGQNFFERLKYEAFSILENWYPKEFWEDSEVFDEYNEKGKLTHYI